MKTIATATITALILIATACSERTVMGADDFAPSFAAANAAESGNKLQCFSGTTDGGYNGTCTLSKNGAILNTIDGDGDPNNSYAGVYVASVNLGGKLLTDVNKLAFSYSGSGASGGSPRFGVPIDEDNDGTTDGYLFADTQACNDGDANIGTLDMINDATCTMYYNNVGYANWAALVAANPTYRVASGALPFVIADQPGTFDVSNVQIGRGAAKAK